MTVFQRYELTYEEGDRVTLLTFERSGRIVEARGSDGYALCLDDSNAELVVYADEIRPETL